MNPTYDLTGPVAMVTGAGSGMGPATAQAFAQTGAAVVLTDINEQDAQAAAEELQERGYEAPASGAMWPTRHRPPP